MRNPGWKCDVCGKDKAEVNHWFIVIRGGDVPIPKGAPQDGTLYLMGQNFESIFLIFLWDDSLAAFPNVHHVCGQDHALQLASRWMHNGTLEKVTI